MNRTLHTLQSRLFPEAIGFFMRPCPEAEATFLMTGLTSWTDVYLLGMRMEKALTFSCLVARFLVAWREEVALERQQTGQWGKMRLLTTGGRAIRQSVWSYTTGMYVGVAFTVLVGFP